MTALELFYEDQLLRKTAITPHLSRLRSLASGLPLAVEFGVKHGASSSALLLGADRVISYDIVPTTSARRLQQIAGDRWQYRIEDSRLAEPVLCHLLFIDSLHTFAQLDAELHRHAGHVMKYLVFHDVITFGSIGADGETGRWSWTYEPGLPVPFEHLGIRPAIDELLIADPSWIVRASYSDSHGLLVLERRI